MSGTLQQIIELLIMQNFPITCVFYDIPLFFLFSSISLQLHSASFIQERAICGGTYSAVCFFLYIILAEYVYEICTYVCTYKYNPRGLKSSEMWHLSGWWVVPAILRALVTAFSGSSWTVSHHKRLESSAMLLLLWAQVSQGIAIS